MKALITRKVGMTSIIADNGALTPVTLLSASPCVVTQVKTAETDGYTAVQLGFEEAKKIGKAQAGHFKQSGITPKVVREFRIDEISDDITVGSKISADAFTVGDTVHATGTSKGKGFAGTIKRHNFKRGRKTHGGQSYRRPGSIGSMYPQKIFKGKRMAGQMGHEQVTVRNLHVALVDTEHNVIGIVGAVPGPRKGIVILKGAN
ncbi:MAG TPA: 50S ribosomal protein L3 [Candidatus Saccharibacteria bacterium]|nr:50S ribosomal protein L3 [Candidatus Saccharibacteria bacterium]MCB9817226.1 50S ribosomal protein L3 [Candidatus Nomurabacteria bacterium]HPD98699.1 50S ribosomal protein L3 [Candidatus Saccharibacteria bacterium]HPR10529.1 50S ribosomal protein L3 [Candidatus Saccharibacteria bacterium]